MTDQVDTNPEVAANEEQQAPQFAIQRIYVKDISFEAPNLPELFNVEYKPQVKMEMNSKSRKVADNHFEVVLSVTLSAELEEKTAFLAEVQQAGLFFINGFNEQQTHQLLGAAAPESLYPYVREVISNLIGRANLPALQLAPVNFMALYAERMQKAQAEAQQQAEGAENTGSETIQ
ncbi:protein-export chaperone SecB [Aliikangiella coralliicola]|uniref:Protein-export protein SecB n=1 Tax=Aliikangiella coralliicola TaxID=2592383 RepID=A0A545UHC8_9GAMM|nr:protein-export chaperone SecB [Aliikangiella coralliicola]TQV88868.1 protein-export chaperone SecB [Aliikangiella coralliicola]